MAVRSCVDQRAIGPAPHRVDRVDHRSFAVELGEVDLDAELLRDGPQPAVDVVESSGPVQVGLADAEQVEVRAVENGDPHLRLSPSSQAVNCSRSPSGASEASSEVGEPGAVAPAVPGVPSEKNCSNEYAPDFLAFRGAGSRNT